MTNGYEGYEALAAIGRTLLDQHGLQDWMFEVENCRNPFRGGDEYTYGLCCWTEKRISVDIRFLFNHHNGLRQTILHEIAHALIGPEYDREHGGHGPRFCELARRLGCRNQRSVGQYEWAWDCRDQLVWDERGQWSLPKRTGSKVPRCPRA